MKARIVLALFAILAMVLVAGCKQEQASDAPAAVAAPEAEKKVDGKPVPKSGPSYDETVEYINRNATRTSVDMKTGDDYTVGARLTPRPGTPCAFDVESLWDGKVKEGKTKTVYFEDLDPSQCGVTEGLGRYAGACSCRERKPCAGGFPTLALPAMNPDRAEKLGDAIKHLAEMCGGKKELF